MSRQTFKELYDQYHKLVFAICMKILSTVLLDDRVLQISEDLTQITFEKVRRSMYKADISTPEKERIWISTIARNTAFNEIRKKNYTIEITSDFGDMDYTSDTESLDILDRISLLETKTEIMTELNKLKEKYKIAIIMKYINGCKNEEIAEELGITYNYATVAINRGLKELSKSKKLQALRRDGIV